MKKVIAFICILVLCFSLCACGKTEISESVSEESVSEESISEESISEDNIMDSSVQKITDTDYEKILSDFNNAEDYKNLWESRKYELWFHNFNNCYYSKAEIPCLSSDTDIEINDYFNSPIEHVPVNNTEDLSNYLVCYGMDIFFFGDAEADYDLFGLFSSNRFSSGDYDTYFLRAVDIENSKYYTVHKITDGGYLYTFFDHSRSISLLENPYAEFYKDKEDISLFESMGSVYCENKLSYADFADITIGDSVDKVIATDSAAKAYMLSHAFNYKRDDSESENSFVSKHLLTDGLLAIYYKKNGEDYIVADMFFSEDFIYSSPYLYDKFGVNYDKQFKILPQDYPPAN